MTIHYLILEGPDATTLKHVTQALQDALASESDVTLKAAGSAVYFSTITDRNNVLDREEGRTFPGQWGFTAGACLLRTQQEVATYVRNHVDRDAFNSSAVQQWLTLVDQEEATAAATYFDKHELFDVVGFHWDMQAA
ncbi:hypothetical protein [Deinococcus soli (ex Cha et al. 2016)]|uniref:Uncharacterized protein n=2 Tax=Deinococcus soli (ex Cha et al. 2016) TaxID=1309411 RepID=A0ACC6KFJ4_9DEIO|nr:hypothetical protein [Deinococcus soli (ex Cha et al. 2016)]MDR6218325.1 hypothetical protein [Deinococcus soli (ex Cha et al. 2016)]MDR6329065.1 hypothetical protein [Deinococcus soli (ex Cha et al. 2016)]MDR6751338.1 hypothetical protein [Deinococcus soli (ex Cha et al. 2016)]